MLAASEKELFSAVTVVVADAAADSIVFRSRLIAACKDVQHLVISDELPEPADFQEPPAVHPDWPPLNLGVRPILGGAFKERPGDWDTGTGEEGQGDGGVTSFEASGTCSWPPDKACIFVAAVILAAAIVAVLK